MMAYSTEEREKALRHCSDGLRDDEVSAKLGMSKQSIASWKKRLFTTGSLEKKKVENKPRKPYKYTPEKINDLLGKSQKAKDTIPSKNNNEQEHLKTNDKEKIKDPHEKSQKPKTPEPSKSINVKEYQKFTGKKKSKKKKVKKIFDLCNR